MARQQDKLGALTVGADGHDLVVHRILGATIVALTNTDEPVSVSAGASIGVPVTRRGELRLFARQHVQPKQLSAPGIVAVEELAVLHPPRDESFGFRECHYVGPFAGIVWDAITASYDPNIGLSFDFVAYVLGEDSQFFDVPMRMTVNQATGVVSFTEAGSYSVSVSATCDGMTVSDTTSVTVEQGACLVTPPNAFTLDTTTLTLETGEVACIPYTVNNGGVVSVDTTIPFTIANNQVCLGPATASGTAEVRATFPDGAIITANVTVNFAQVVTIDYLTVTFERRVKPTFPA